MAVIRPLYVLLIAGILSIAVSAPQQQLDEDTSTEAEDAGVSDKPVLGNQPTWSALFSPSSLNTTMALTSVVELTITYIDPTWGNDFELLVLAEHPELVSVHRAIRRSDLAPGETVWTGNFSADALFLGRTRIYVELHRPNIEPERSAESLEVSIMRNIGTMDIVFKVFVGCFVMILYTNFGAALELSALKRILLRPVGPAIGFVGQFVIMPILSYFIGYFLFHDMIELRLGLFFTGSTPGGGLSNIFTVVLNGNLNLSITMTALSNLAAFGMMPLWIFTLGALIFHDGNFVIPYATIATMSFSLVLPLCVGLALQRYAPKVAVKMVKLLKPISICLIVIVTAFAFTVNAYMFKLFSLKILIASSALPWIGYCLGWLMAFALRQPSKDALTIAIETGIQNTGIAIFMLNFTLPQPQADMTSAVPVASSMMTPLPLLLIYVLQKIFRRTSIEEVEPASTKEAQMNEIKAIAQQGQTNPISVSE